jgi:DNA mismatch repair protein MutS
MARDVQPTPMMAQYRRIKSELPKDALLLFRLGDFYEMFFEDAQVGAQLLNVALTKRGTIPMCGIPFHAANSYVGRLLKAGRKVALCDQVEDTRPGQLVRREVTRILSPGTHFDERMLAAERNNYLAAVYALGKVFGLALSDLTTGDFIATELDDESALLTELQRLRPAELIYPAEARPLAELLSGARPNRVGSQVFSGAAADHKLDNRSVGVPEAARDFPWIPSGYEDWAFAPETAVFTVRDHFKVASLDGFGLKDRPAAIGAAGAVLHYLTQHLRRDVSNLTRISFYQRSDYLVLDFTTLRHLEVLEPLLHGGPSQACLYRALNRTVTPMGARRLRDWLSQPLARLEPIRRRQEAVQALMDNSGALEDLRTHLGQVRDLERTIGRLSGGNGNARDLLALRLGLDQIPGLKQCLGLLIASDRGKAGSRNGEPSLLSPNAPTTPEDSNLSDAPDHRPGLLEELRAEVLELPDVQDLVSRAIADEPPLTVKEGGLIRDGFDPALDELRSAMRSGKDWIAKLQQDETVRTGIQSLKVRFNSVFGYYIEVTKANLDKVPSDYIRKQTIANGERFVTPQLKETEGKILGAEERSFKLEYELFQTVRGQVLSRLREIQQVASALAQLDVLSAFAETARLHAYSRPRMGAEGIISIREGRHPVLEQTLAEERFVPNDTQLDNSTQIALITGPNMAGKSTYIRQVALLVLLAHTGSFIPAAEARIDLVDRIFSRIGASDDLARGQSTFMVEMCETANILNHATPQSLIVLDEIGRGTSTFDGLSLAWSILEHLHNQAGSKTLFATHYHELTELAARLPRLKNYNVAVREWRDQIVFLRRIVEGGTDKSYGIQVARLAGVPKSVLDRAKEILRNLEESELTPEGNVRPSRRRQHDRELLQKLPPATQLDLFRA